MTTVSKKLKVEAMDCASCALSVDFDLEDLRGVKKARTSYAKEICEVEFDDTTTSLNEIIARIGKTGYKAKLAK